MKRLNIRGFTLIELMVAIAVTGLLTVIIMSFMVNTVAESAQESAREDLLTQAQTALDTASNDILQSADADTVNRYADPNGPSGNQFGWHSSGTTLVLATAVTTAQNTIIFDDPLHYITAKNNLIYYVSNGTLYRRILADSITGNRLVTSCPVGASSSTCPPDATLATGVSSFAVTYYDNNGALTSDPSTARGVQLAITMTRVKYNKTISVSYAQRTVFRNE